VAMGVQDPSSVAVYKTERAEGEEMKQPFKVGDKVRTKFFCNYRDVIRTVIKVEEYDCESGWHVEADGGMECPCCGRRASVITPPIDSGWFEKVEE